MKRECIEIWSDSFHEGDWCCSSLAQIALSNGFSVKRDYVRGLQPHYVQIATFCGQQGRISRTIRAILSGQL